MSVASIHATARPCKGRDVRGGAGSTPAVHRTAATAKAEVGGQVITGPRKGSRGGDPGSPGRAGDAVLEITTLDVDAPRRAPRVPRADVEGVAPATARVAPPDGGDPVPASVGGRAVQAVAVDPMGVVLLQTTSTG